MGATENWIVAVALRCSPAAPVLPADPPGTVTVSVAPGGRGDEAWNARVVGAVWTQLPEMDGLKVGNGLPFDKGSSKLTASVASGATSADPEDGALDTTVRSGFVTVDAPADEGPTFETART